MKTALVTGDMGFLGRHFVDALEDRGYEVTGCDVRRDPVDSCQARFTNDDRRYHLVVHAAGIVGGRAKIDGDPLAHAENLELDALYFRWVAQTRPGWAVYLSSSAVYPIPLQTTGQGTLLHENDQPIHNTHTYIGQPDQIYGWSKLVGEKLAFTTRELTGQPITVVRPFSGYGTDQDLTYPFPTFVRRALRRDDPFDVWGSGRQVRDFIHVSDVITGTLTAVDAGHDGILNLCTGIPTSFTELKELVCREVGYRPQTHYLDAAPTGVSYRVGDPTRMLRYHRPSVTLEQGVRLALESSALPPETETEIIL